jgi:Icc-related predicted phosphoesterase
MTILDGEAVVIKGIGFAGVKGFGGGFNKYMLSMFGEGAMKAFVQEAVDEALHLDRALARLDQEHQNIKKIAVMHYAPIYETIVGEPEVIYTLLLKFKGLQSIQAVCRYFIVRIFQNVDFNNRLRIL